MSRTSPPGCEVGSVPYGDGRQTAVIFKCACGANYARRFPSGTVNYDVAAKAARNEGWAADPDRAGSARCPACKSARRSPGDSPKPKKEAITMAATATPSLPLEKAPNPSTAADQVREATPQQRQRIRSLLDKHFDDAAGCYLDGYSDQKIGAELTLPHAMVTKIREAAYGPIKVDPEVTALRAELADMQRKIDQLTRQQLDAFARLNSIEKKRGVAA